MTGRFRRRQSEFIEQLADRRVAQCREVDARANWGWLPGNVGLAQQVREDRNPEPFRQADGHIRQPIPAWATTPT